MVHAPQRTEVRSTEYKNTVYQLKVEQVFTMKYMTLMKEKAKLFMFFMVINNLLINLHFTVLNTAV